MGCVDVEDRTQPSMPQDSASYRSFASLRMTTKRNPVILNEVKDLYESSRDKVLKIPQLSVMNQKSFNLQKIERFLYSPDLALVPVGPQALCQWPDVMCICVRADDQFAGSMS